MTGSINELLYLLEASIADIPGDADVIKARVEAIVRFLNLDENDTDENCRLVNNFILLRILDVSSHHQRMKKLPKELAAIIEDMGMCLHDTHTAPEIARNFRSAPQDLYERLPGLGRRTR